MLSGTLLGGVWQEEHYARRTPRSVLTNGAAQAAPLTRSNDMSKDTRTTQEKRREISDLHKDVYGYRPDMETWQEIIACTDAQIEEYWDELCAMLTSD